MTPKSAQRLREALAERFEADVEAERVAPQRYRFTVIAEQFEDMSQLKRQNVLWDVVDRVVDKEAALGISLILAYAPAELEQAT